MRKFLSWVVLFLLMNSFVVSLVYAKEGYPKNYQVIVMSEINDSLREKGYRELFVDSDLCTLAELAANDAEKAYPNKISQDWFSDLVYKNYLIRYSIYNADWVSKMNLTIDFEKDMDGKIGPYTIEDLRTSFGNLDTNGIAINEDITDGCVGLSKGNKKPFMYFVGAAEKDTSWLGVLKQHWKTFWRVMLTSS